MKLEKEQMDRRQFLKTASGNILGMALATTSLETIAKSASSNESPNDLDHYDFIMPRVK